MRTIKDFFFKVNFFALQNLVATASAEFLPPSQWIAPALGYGLKIHGCFRK